MAKTVISENMTLLRKSNGYSQKDVGDMLGVSKQAISMYERGERKPEAELLGRLADIYGVDINVIYGRRAEDMPRPVPEDIIIYHRNGRTVRKQFSKEQMKMLLAMIEAVPEEKEDEEK